MQARIVRTMRERDQGTIVAVSQQFEWLGDSRVWICESVSISPPAPPPREANSPQGLEVQTRGSYWKCGRNHPYREAPMLAGLTGPAAPAAAIVSASGELNERWFTGHCADTSAPSSGGSAAQIGSRNRPECHCRCHLRSGALWYDSGEPGPQTRNSCGQVVNVDE